MLILLSPAKTLDESPINIKDYTEPAFIRDSQTLVQILKKKKKKDLMNLMNVSEKIAELNVERFNSFKTPFNLDNAKPAIFTFKGDVYLGLDATDFSKRDLNFAQKNLRILSGLYGILKPLDLMQSYRLEMGTKLKNKKGKNLYEFWGKKISEQINQDIEKNKDEIILNLASQEYFKAVDLTGLNGKVVHVHFKENRNGTLKVISFNAKKARGAMAKEIIQKRVKSINGLKKLEVMGYQYEKDLSSATDLHFIKN